MTVRSAVDVGLGAYRVGCGRQAQEFLKEGMMNGSIRSCAAIAALGLSACSMAWTTIMAYDFEAPSFTLGNINGQSSWVGTVDGGSLGTMPAIVGSPAPTLGAQSLKLEVSSASGAQSSVEIATPVDLVAAGYSQVRVSYSIYRSSVGAANQNLWFYWFDNGTPTYGLDWDIGGMRPFGFETGAVEAPRVVGRWAELVMEWDLVNLVAKSWYDGSPVDTNFPISGITKLTGWGIYLAHDAGTSTVGDKAYIDNFRMEVVPEPATVGALLIGTICLLRRRR